MAFCFQNNLNLFIVLAHNTFFYCNVCIRGNNAYNMKKDLLTKSIMPRKQLSHR